MVPGTEDGRESSEIRAEGTEKTCSQDAEEELGGPAEPGGFACLRALYEASAASGAAGGLEEVDPARGQEVSAAGLCLPGNQTLCHDAKAREPQEGNAVGGDS